MSLPTSPGLDTMGCMQAAHQGSIRTAMCLGGNLFGSNPASEFAREALRNIDLITYLSTTLNTGHAWGRGKETIILPVCARDEEPEPTTQESMFNLVRLSDGGAPRLEGPRTEVDIIASLGEQVFADRRPIAWSKMKKTCNIREMIGLVVPGYEKAGTIGDHKEEFHIPNRHLTTTRFPTDTGKAKFHPHDIPPLQGQEQQLRLMTVRSEGQFNTVVYEEEDIYRGQDRRDVILLNKGDIDRLGLVVNQKVLVKSETGEMPNILVREYDIREGNALMYFPEANVLIPTVTDPDSRTPAFKKVLVTLAPIENLEPGIERSALPELPVVK